MDKLSNMHQVSSQAHLPKKVLELQKLLQSLRTLRLSHRIMDRHQEHPLHHLARL